MKTSVLAAIAASTIGSAAFAAPTVVYTNTFEGIPQAGATESFATGTFDGAGAIVSTQSFPDVVGDFFLRNATVGNPAGLTTLTLTDLPNHDSIDLDLVLAFIDSWDSRNGSVSPDNFDVLVDGNVIASFTINNQTGTLTDLGGGEEIAARQNYGFNGGFVDSLADLTDAGALSFAHTGSSITFGFRASGAGWQGGDDESWAIDNIVVSVNPVAGPVVPEPASWAMMIAGFGLVGGAMRRRSATLRFA